jgi:hypothetical protein
MRRLLFKELREKWIWLLPLVGSTSGLVLLHDGYVFIGDSQTPWLILSMLAALGLGASAYSSELAGGSADFVRSRPVSWKRMLLAKFVVGLAFLTVTAILATVVYRLNCPAQYLSSADLPHLASGFGVAMLIMGCAYVAGFICSVVLPGAFGGALLMAAIVTSYVLMQYCLEQFHAKAAAYWSGYLAVIGAAVATVIISRFGLTLPTTRRLTRYLSVIGIFALIGAPFDYCLKWDPFSPPRTSNEWNLSPDGRYAALEQTRDGLHVYHSYLVRISDGRKVETDWLQGSAYAYGSNACWYGQTLAAIETRQDHADRLLAWLWMGRTDESGRLSRVRIPIPTHKDYGASLISSPTGRLVMVAAPTGVKEGSRLTFADLTTLHPLSAVVIDGARDYWWQSDREIGYIDRTGRHIARVPE